MEERRLAFLLQFLQHILQKTVRIKKRLFGWKATVFYINPLFIPTSGADRGRGSHNDTHVHMRQHGFSVLFMDTNVSTCRSWDKLLFVVSYRCPKVFVRANYNWFIWLLRSGDIVGLTPKHHSVFKVLHQPIGGYRCEQWQLSWNHCFRFQEVNLQHYIKGKRPGSAFLQFFNVFFEHFLLCYPENQLNQKQCTTNSQRWQVPRQA